MENNRVELKTTMETTKNCVHTHIYVETEMDMISMYMRNENEKILWMEYGMCQFSG